MTNVGRRDIKRAIFGANDKGVNVTLYEGPLRPIGIDDAELAASSKDAGEGVYLAWASHGVELTTDDYANTVPDFNLELKPGETRFVRVEVAPGGESPMHRTPQINDYLIALQGELTMYLEDGSSCGIKAGDMFVQLAGWHAWKNEGTVPFIMAGVVVGIETDIKVPFGVEMAGKDV